MRYKFFCVITLFLLTFVANEAHAFLWDFGYHNISQFRKGPAGTRQAPVNQYFSLGASELPRELSLQTDFRLFADGYTNEHNFDLYQAQFHIEPVPHFTIDGGRQFLSDGFDVELVDGASFSIVPGEAHFGGTFYAGAPRYLEEGNFYNVTEGLVIGANVDLLNIKDVSGRFSARWKKLDASKSSYRKNDTVYLGLALSKQFSNAWSTPQFYGNAEVNVSGKKVEVGTFGFKLYPHWRVALTLEGNRFDVDRSSNEQTIFGNFLSGSILQAREAIQIKLTGNLNFAENFYYMRYNVNGKGTSNGYMVDASLDHYWSAAKLSSYAEYYFRKSFGGDVNGAFVNGTFKYFKHIFFDLGIDASKYSKITNQKATAVSVVGDVGYAFSKRCRLALGGEFNHNQWYDQEGRITVNLEIGFDKNDYTPEKRSKNVRRKFHEI